LPPHVCRIFTAENYAHRASVEDVVSNDKPGTKPGKRRPATQFPVRSTACDE
jgi:hypothetical protein